jgi:acyl-coenzyme A thioesterase PaaI-like protein
VGARLCAIEPGRAEAVVPRGGDAVLWLLADFVSGLAVTGTLEAGQRITTLRLTLHVVLRDVAGGTLRAVGSLDERAPDVALSTAVITDDAGRTVARAQGRNAVLIDAVAAETAPGSGPGWSDPPRSAADLVVDGAPPDPHAVNYAGVVQGGVLASLPARAPWPTSWAGRPTRRARRSCAPSPPTGARCTPRPSSSTAGDACAAAARCCATTAAARC